MTKTIQNNISLIAGLFFIAQSTMVPVASAAGLFTENQPIYWHAATSVEPIMFDDHGSANLAIIKVIETANSKQTIGKVIKQIEESVSVTKVTDNSEPTIEEVKAYVLGEIKNAGLNVREAEAIVFCESRWDYQAVNKMNKNGSNDKGLWQINSIHKSISDADKLDYKASTKWAIEKRLRDGSWSAWSCSRKISAR